MPLNRIDIALQLLHLRLHALLPVLLWCGIRHHRQALVLVMQLLPVAFEAVEDLVAFVRGEAFHGAASEVLGHVLIVLVLCALNVLLAALDVFRRRAKVL